LNVSELSVNSPGIIAAQPMLEGKSILYFSYNGMLDPLGQSQVIPYLQALTRFGARFTLVSFERPNAFTREGEEISAALRADLNGHNIEWRRLRYHRRPSLPATAYDVFAGVRLGAALARQQHFDLVHARSHIAAAIALRLRQRFGFPMIFDVRGLLADEYVDAGHWKKDSVPYRITKNVERRSLYAADGIVTLTEKIWPIMSEWDPLRNRNVPHEVVPCCADLNRFKFDQAERNFRRDDLKLNDRFVLAYSGSIDGWYLTEEMVDFFAVLKRQIPQAYFLWLTPSRHERVRAIMNSRGIGESDYGVRAVSLREMPSYLSAADAGISFIKPCFSKLASSPTKYAEYLGCGLPLIINSGVGDSDDLIAKDQTGVFVSGFDPEHYDRAASQVAKFADHPIRTREHNRAIAERRFDVKTVGAERYARLYERVFAATRRADTAPNFAQ
jgi:glycosyltransferase involved in cell wall biosynthesis